MKALVVQRHGCDLLAAFGESVGRGAGDVAFREGLWLCFTGCGVEAHDCCVHGKFCRLVGKGGREGRGGLTRHFTICAVPHDFIRERRCTIQDNLIWNLVAIGGGVNAVLISLCSIVRHSLQVENRIFFLSIAFDLLYSASHIFPYQFFSNVDILTTLVISSNNSGPCEFGFLNASSCHIIFPSLSYPLRWKYPFVGGAA